MALVQVNDPKYAAWHEEDFVNISWLWNSIQPEVNRNLMFLSNAKAIWDTLQENYSLKKVMPVVLQTKISSIAQGLMSIQDYYNLINGVWLEMDHYRILG